MTASPDETSGGIYKLDHFVCMCVCASQRATSHVVPQMPFTLCVCQNQGEGFSLTRAKADQANSRDPVVPTFPAPADECWPPWCPL